MKNTQLRDDVALLVAVAESRGFLVLSGEDFESDNDGSHWDRGGFYDLGQ